jgi:hypothetical protein
VLGEKKWQGRQVPAYKIVGNICWRFIGALCFCGLFNLFKSYMIGEIVVPALYMNGLDTCLRWRQGPRNGSGITSPVTCDPEAQTQTE